MIAPNLVSEDASYNPIPDIEISVEVVESFLIPSEIEIGHEEVTSS